MELDLYAVGILFVLVFQILSCFALGMFTDWRLANLKMTRELNQAEYYSKILDLHKEIIKEEK